MTAGVSSAAENTAALLQGAAQAGLAVMIPGALEPRAGHPRAAVSLGQEVVAAQGAVLDRVLDGRSHMTGDGLERQAYGRFHAARTKTPWGERCQRTFALVEGETILASAERYRLAGVLDGRAVQVCGIGSLWAGPSGRGVGDAQRLIDALLHTAATEGAEMALLFRQAGADDDRRNGFQELPLTDLTLRVTESSRRGAPMTMMRAGEERDLAAIAAMGRMRAGPFRFHLERDVDFIRYAITTKRLLAGLGSTNSRQLQFFIAEEGITAAAYVIVSVVGDTWTLEECGDRDATGARVGALLQALIAREPAERRPTIHTWLPPRFLPPQVTIASATPSIASIGVRMLGPGAMVRPLSTDDVLFWRNDVF